MVLMVDVFGEYTFVLSIIGAKMNRRIYWLLVT